MDKKKPDPSVPIDQTLCESGLSAPPPAREDSDDRTERLLGIDTHIGRDVREHRRRKARSARLAAAERARALGHGVAHEVADAFDRGAIDQRSDRRGRLARVSHGQRPCALGEPLRK